MVEIGRLWRIPNHVLKDALLRPKDATDGDISFEKIDAERARIVFPTTFGNATFEKVSRDEAFLIRWRLSSDGSPEQTEEQPVSVHIFDSAEKLCMNYIESAERKNQSV